MMQLSVLETAIIGWLAIGWTSLILGFLFNSLVSFVVAIMCFSTSTILTLCNKDEDE